MFYNRNRKDFGFLSNFHPSPIEIDGIVYPDVEHYYQAQKSTDPDYRLAVMSASTPGKAKRLADSRVGHLRIAKQSWFRKRPELLRPDWNEVKLSVMRLALIAKFTQNRDLKQMLLMTGEAVLIEDSKSDLFWGWDKDGNGQNNLGKLLMEIRTELNRNV